MDTIDVLYWSFILLVLFGGAFCIVVFGSKERNKRDALGNSYRFRKYRGEIIRASGKASLFEPRGSYYYLEKMPFSADASADSVKGKDGKLYRAVALIQLHFPENTAHTAAESFFGLDTEQIADMLAEPLEETIKGVIAEYDGTQDKKTLSELFRDRANKALLMFGTEVLSVSDFRIMEEQ